MTKLANVILLFKLFSQTFSLDICHKLLFVTDLFSFRHLDLLSISYLYKIQTFHK
jgi:hypothetical protein